MEKALLVFLDSEDPFLPINYQIEELKNLAEASLISVVDIIIQKKSKPTPNFLIGRGKVEEIKNNISEQEIEIVIFNDELSPAQIKNLERELDVKIIDRSVLILDIFAKRAQTKEAMLEIELAQLRYFLPRLVGLTNSLSRQGGTSGSFSAKGPGEKKLELDRRRIYNQINRLEKELAKVHNEKKASAKRRNKSSTPIVGLVGYTNAGKSATMNNLIKRSSSPKTEVLEKDMLFATLGTNTRRIKMSGFKEFILIDTVGFVSKLPHHLVNSFKSTLESINDCDLLIHVVDSSNPFYEKQIEVTNTVLDELKTVNVPTLYAFSKSDVSNKEFFMPDLENTILFSNKTLANFESLEKMIVSLLSEGYIETDLYIPHSEGKIISFIESNTIILAKIITENSIYYRIRVTEIDFNRYLKNFRELI
ncbi:MAG: GTPase HflX [Erysipelotrichales bacterium]|nr:GTPase HflX [Erysipelotrichales bacterium]